MVLRFLATQRKALTGAVAAAAALAGVFAPVSLPISLAAASRVHAADAPPSRPDRGQDRAEKLYTYGLTMISERALDPITPKMLAVSGLQGLSSLDHDFTVTTQGGWLVLSMGSRAIATLRTPADDDAASWGGLVARAIDASRRASSLLNESSEDVLNEAFFEGMLEPLDSYSRYAKAETARHNRESRNGFGGVGIRYEIENGRLRVQEVQPETPAAAAGLMVGDVITRIDGIDVFAMNGGRGDTAALRDTVRNRLRGAVDSPLRLTVLRARGEKEMMLHRGLVVPQTVFLDDVGSGIAVVRVTSFNQQTSKALSDVLSQYRAQSGGAARGVILDMRGNPGGLLDQAVSVADLFLTQGRIVFTRGRHPEAQQSYSAGGGDILSGLPVVVLLDGRSASAAEIVGAALQDNGRAVVMGSSTYGKGTVQTVIRLPNDGEITLTWSRFHSPSGYALHGLGVMPVVCVGEASGSPSQVLSEGLDNTGAALTRRMAEWRSLPLWDEAGRNRLRSACPAQDEDGWAVDVTAARQLLQSPTLYSRALSISYQQSARRY